MVAYDELGSLVPIKRTLQVIDYQNQANKESEVRREISALFSCYLCRSVNLQPTHRDEVIPFYQIVSESAPNPVFILGTHCLCVHV